MEKNKELYNRFCLEELGLPIFMQPWWLDVVCEKGTWGVCVAQDKGGNITGVLPYYLTKFWGFTVIRQPPLSPHVGVWINYPKNLSKVGKRYSFENKVCKELIAQLPKVAYYSQMHPVQFENWLPFYWKGFEQQTMYTHEIVDCSDLDVVWEGLKSSVRGKIRKGEREGYVVIKGDDVSELLKLRRKVFERQSKPLTFSEDTFQKLHFELKQKKKCKVLYCINSVDKKVAGIYLVWDNKRCYNLVLVGDADAYKNGASQMLLWEGISFASKNNLIFDFEGSMMEQIESIFYSFNGRKKPYHKLSISGNRLIQLFNSIRSVN